MGENVKNPEHEAERPSPVHTGTKPSTAAGPNTQGNGRGKREQDPEGQQGGTDGGSKK